MEWIEITADWDAERLRKVTARSETEQNDVDATVAAILADVKANGDAAVLAYNKKFDGCNCKDLRISEAEIEEALQEVGPEMVAILQEAADNIRVYHEEQIMKSWIKEFRPGVRLGTHITPIRRVGLYVPGGRAAYPSTVLMDAVPAKVAGVPSLVMISPPNKDGRINPYILAAAHVAGVDEMYRVGGAQGIAALAYGTETIRPVYKIVGPGNMYVATAKKQVFGTVGIDMIAGPSEVGVIADSSANPTWVAADLLAQAEHDPMAAVYLATPDKAMAEQVVAEVERQMTGAPREEIMRSSVERWMRVFVTPDIETAVAVMNGIAPEHLELALDNPEIWLPKVENAGAIFMGHYTPEPVGDYFAGPNHTLPTSGTAAFSSPLGVYDYSKRSSILSYDKQALTAIAHKVEALAKAEGLYGHAASVAVRHSEEVTNEN
ncbi:histidinol dehydrogenase [Veillonella magna]|uniref:histidinol dehydrogenase n=1 Tax=Veillonella magna TaxID=464322 RepID=UPI0026DCFFCD|nr:histidinol dehydrogenase [Veillonella magna]